MAEVYYNGVTLPNSSFTDFRQSAVYEESNTDRIYTRFDITCHCIFNVDYLLLLAPDLVGSAFSTPSELMVIVRQRLMTQRKKLSVSCNGIELIPQPVANLKGSVDAKNGPQPQYCNIVEMHAGTFLVIWSIVAHYWEKTSVPVGIGPGTTPVVGNDVLYNRWTESVEMDDLMRSTLTREGKFVIRSDNQHGFVADQLRTQMAICGVPKGFLRKKSRYTVSPDGLGLAYIHVDQEQFKMPPPPAFRAKGTYTETTTRRGAVRYGEVQVTLWGMNRDVDQSQLILVAIQVCAAKLRRKNLGAALTSKGNAFGVLEQAAITVDMYDENKVSCSIRIMMKPTSRIATDRVQDVSANINEMPFVPGSDNVSYNPVDFYLPFGTADGLLSAAAYYDPSIINTKLDPGTRQMNNGNVPGQEGLFGG